MYYDTPKINGYVRFLNRNRASVILFYLLCMGLMLIWMKPLFVSSDQMFWLEESKELERSLKQNVTTTYVGKIDLHLKHFDNASLTRLARFHDHLTHMEHVQKVDSLFNASYIYRQQNGADSSMVQSMDMKQFDAEKIKKIVATFPSHYQPFVDKNFNHLTFYLFSDKPVSIDPAVVPFTFEYTSLSNENIDPSYLLLYFLASIAAIVIFFRFIFKNYIVSLVILSIVIFTLVSTFTLIRFILGIEEIYIALTFLVSGVAILDTLFFYYRWHVSQYKADNERALFKSVNRNLIPAFWTSLITFLGLGTLILVDSQIIRLLSLSLILASIISYLMNITLLPALLSYFSIRHPRVEFGRFGTLFAKSEMHYNRRFLIIFLTITSAVALIGFYYLLASPERLFTQSVNNHILVISTPVEDIDLKTIEKIRTFEQELKQNFHGIKEIDSLSSVLPLLNEANTGSRICDEQNLMQAMFFLQLYDLDQRYIDGDKIIFTIHMEQTDKIALINWIKRYKPLTFYFSDYDSLISTAKHDRITLMAVSLLSVLIMIGLIMGRIFRQPHLIWVGFIANAVPIIWFGLFVELAHFPLSLEVLIAMTLSLGFSSDATIHFAFKYYRNRYFGKSQRHALEIMFFYAGIPVIIGSLILAVVFGALIFTPIESMQIIGGYGAILILISLLCDLFLLPVLLLYIDPFRSPNETVTFSALENRSRLQRHRHNRKNH